MNQNKLSTKFRQVRFKEETDNSIIEIAIRFGRTVPKKIDYWMELFERMLKKGEIKEYENI